MPRQRFLFFKRQSERATCLFHTSTQWCSGRAQAFKTIGRGFAPRQRFVFFTRRRRRRLSIYQSYYGREEVNNSRSEWRSGKALAFKTTGRGFTPRQAFLFFTRRRRRRVSIHQSYYGREEINNNRSEWCSGRALAFKTIGRGFAPRQSLSFSNVDIDDACQFINHISHRGDKKLQVDVGDAVQCINHISAVCLPPALSLFHT